MAWWCVRIVELHVVVHQGLVVAGITTTATVADSQCHFVAGHRVNKMFIHVVPSDMFSQLPRVGNVPIIELLAVWKAFQKLYFALSAKLPVLSHLLSVWRHGAFSASNTSNMGWREIFLLFFPHPVKMYVFCIQFWIPPQCENEHISVREADIDAGGTRLCGIVCVEYEFSVRNENNISFKNFHHKIIYYLQ